MSASVKQYTDLYEANRDKFGDRDEALKALSGAMLPDLFAPDYGLNVGRVRIPVDVAESFRCDVPTVSTLMGLVLNDTFVPSTTLAGRLPEGVVFGPLSECMDRLPEMIDPTELTALNDLLLQDGVIVYVPDGVRLHKPLQLVNIFSAPVDLMAVRRLVVILGENACARMLVCDHTQDDLRKYLSLEVVQISLARGSHFDLVNVEEASPLTGRRLEMRARLAADSSLAVTMAHLGGGDSAADIRVHLDGHGSEARVNGMIIAGGESRVANATTVWHHGERTRSEQLFKYVADGAAICDFRGRIVVDEAARFTEAYQNNRNLLASDRAAIHTEPTLEIYCDDVKCSHGAATGQLDTEALFYMRSRGIPEEQARHMLMEAFMADVIDGVSVDGLPARLRLLVERRFNGVDSAVCANCVPNNDLSTPNCDHV